ncbi:MAG: hypothetical protein HYV26_07470 [Candidatus Hydrogenedentes bacterium]|nr:hypothetical protein [Candidatus Hydrogenedentota bacterium]
MAEGVKGLEPYFAAMAQAVPFGVVLADAEGMIVFASTRASDLLGHDGLAGRRLLDLVTPGTDEVPFSSVLDQEQPWSKAVHWRSAAGKDSTLETAIIPLDATGAPRLVGVLLVPPGQFGTLDTRFVQTEKLVALDNVVAGVAHELNNTLTVILGYTELLLQKPLDNELRGRLSIICEKAERCRRIVENLLRFARKKEAPKVWLNLNELLRNTLGLCEYQLKMDHIALELSLDDRIAPLPLQRREMQGVFLSLINNAQQALVAIEHRARQLIVRSELAGEVLRVEFTDTGCGIPADVQHKIFDPFFTTRDVGEGLGLGLSVSYGILLEHHGKMWLEKSDEDGSTFVLELPAVMPQG